MRVPLTMVDKAEINKDPEVVTKVPEVPEDKGEMDRRDLEAMDKDPKDKVKAVEEATMKVPEVKVEVPKVPEVLEVVPAAAAVMAKVAGARLSGYIRVTILEPRLDKYRIGVKI